MNDYKFIKNGKGYLIQVDVNNNGYTVSAMDSNRKPLGIRITVEDDVAARFNLEHDESVIDHMKDIVIDVINKDKSL